MAYVARYSGNQKSLQPDGLRSLCILTKLENNVTLFSEREVFMLNFMFKSLSGGGALTAISQGLQGYNSGRLLCKKAFTLAEVLVTLGIIGVVASLTMPTLIQNHKKKVTAVKLEKFYSIMTQAIESYESERNLLPEDMRIPADTVQNGKNLQVWYNNTFGKYLKSVSQKSSDLGFLVLLADGSGFNAYVSDHSQMHIFYCTEAKYCNNKLDGSEGNFNGQTGFLFGLYKGEFITSGPDFQNMTREELLKQCSYGNTEDANVSAAGRRHACTRLIQVDGWEFKDDYPWKQTILK